MTDSWGEAELDAAERETMLMGSIGHARILSGGRISVEGKSVSGVSGPPAPTPDAVPPLPNQLPYEIDNCVLLDKTKMVHLNGRKFQLNMEEFQAVLKIVAAASVRAAQEEMMGLFTAANEEAINGLQDPEVSE